MQSLKSLRLFMIALLSLFQPAMALAESSDAFEFFQEEAKVVSASRIPQSRQQSPATVYVVTQDDIKNSGAQSIWDALRGVPGVDILQTRTDQAEVSIRGLDKALNNRTLILLDGKTVMSPFFDYVTWEAIPVTLQDIDRIEVVEGPASAMYGANAVSGVVNIITKKPEQWNGGELSYTGGERNTQIGRFNYGRRQDKFSYKLDGGWRSMNQFERAEQLASEAGKFNAYVGYAPDADSEWSASGGVSDINTQTSAGSIGNFYDKGIVSYSRADYRYKRTKLQGFWNHFRTKVDQLAALGSADLDSDAYQAEVDQSATLPFGNEIAFGANYRRNAARSSTLPPGLLVQDLWSLFAEDRWDLADHWSLTGSGRIDRHPFTPISFSPRGSLIFAPVREQAFRLSAGTAFRNPTLLENTISASTVSPNPGAPPLTNPPFTTIQTVTTGSRTLGPERISTIEVAHNGQFGPFQTNLTGFHYTLKQIIASSPPQVTGLTADTIQTATSFMNRGQVSAWGTEMGLVARVMPWLTTYANYSYQDLRDEEGAQNLAAQSPRHKANVGLTAKRHAWTGDLQVHWVDKTQWLAITNAVVPVNAYFLLNAHVGYAFSGRWEGWEAGVTAFNLLNHDHYESLPSLSGLPASEIIRSRWTGTVSYKF